MSDLIKILVVDDEYELMEGAMDFAHLMNPEYQFYKQKTVDEGLGMLKTLNPDIIFLDRNFVDTRKSGVYFLNEIKYNDMYKDYSSVPIIGIGSFTDDERELLTEFDPKPLSYKNFEDMIKKYVVK